MFFLLCLAAYGFAKRPSAPDPVSDAGRDEFRRLGAFGASVFFFALGLLTKPSLVPVPALLLLLDFWPLRRFPAGLRPLLRAAPRLLAEKIPYFLLSAAAAWASTRAHQASDAIADIPLLLRLKTIPIHCGFYLFKIFRPRNLSVLYPDVLFTRPDLLIALLLLAAVLLVPCLAFAGADKAPKKTSGEEMIQISLGSNAHSGKTWRYAAGGKGRVIGTMFGCIFLNTLFNGFSQMGVDPFVQDVLKGVVLVLAVTLDVASNKKKS